MIKLAYHQKPNWPPLAWLARCKSSDQVVSIFHGSRVETTEDWYCEAVWDGAYSQGDFDRTDVIAGSGGRKRRDKLIFVSSGSTVDRLQAIQAGNTCWISNSLACLLVSVNAFVPSCYKSYFQDFGSIAQGLERYKRTLRTSAGEVAFTYFDNLVWDNYELKQACKPHTASDFRNFASYHRFLSGAMRRISQNLRSDERTWRYSMLSTLSSGYDSTAVSTLAANAGCREAIAFSKARDGAPDQGALAAQALRLKLHCFERSGWRMLNLPEVPFIAGDARGAECHFLVAKDVLHNKVLMTGFYGDNIWAKTSTGESGTLARGNRSGLSLTEYRLWAGFIHCPVPFWGARRSKAIRELSNSGEMRPWDVGGDYSRPICRRIAEMASVPRSGFGVAKHVTSELLFASSEFLSPDSMTDFAQWLIDNTTHFGSTRVRLGMLADKMFYETIRQIERTSRATQNFSNGRPLLNAVGQSKSLARLTNLGCYMPLVTLRRRLFPWAVEHASRQYGDSILSD